ncbi:MAG: hypothetical protein RL069_640 [Planctomycetota bacterium]|jgi:hypothetical protein
MPSLGFAVDLHLASGTLVAGIDLHRFFCSPVLSETVLVIVIESGP